MKILIVDDTPEIREVLTFLLESVYEVTLREAESGNEAIRILHTDPAFDCIISDYNMPDGSGEDISRYLQSIDLKIPFILCSSTEPNDHSYFKAHPPFGHVVKPEIFLPLIDLLKPIVEKSATPDYVRIRLSTVLRHGLLSSDLYVKLNEKKYVKIMRQGDVFDASDFAKYESKQIEFLYAKASEAKDLLSRMIDSLRDVAENAPPLTLDQGMPISNSVLEVIFDFNNLFGFTPEVQKLTKESVALAVQSIRKSPKLAQLFSKLTIDPDSYLASHSAALAYLACGLASLLSWTSDVTFYKLTLAAFLHDLPLDDELSKLDTLKELEMTLDDFTPEQKKRFMNHPTSAAELSDALDEVPSDVNTIIFQHHERPDGSGFPQGMTHEGVHPLASVFIVAEVMLAYRFKAGREADFAEYLSCLDPSFRKGPFRALFDAITNAVMVSA